MAEAISLEEGREKKNENEGIHTLISGKILKKYYLLLKFNARKTGTNRRKVSKGSRKVMNLVKPKNGFEPVLHTKVLDSYHRADIPTALPGKRAAKKKRKRPTFRSEF